MTLFQLFVDVSMLVATLGLFLGIVGIAIVESIILLYKIIRRG